MPSRRRVLGSQPKTFWIRVLSEFRPFTPLGALEIVVPLQLHAGDVFHDIDELIDAHHFAAADVDRLHEVAVREHLGAVQAVIDIHEAAGLGACAPDLDFVFSAEFGGDDFAANGRRRLFAAAIVGAVWPVDVVVTSDAGLDAKVLAEMAAHALAEKLFPAVAVLWHRGISIRLDQRRMVWIALLFGVVNAGAGRDKRSASRRYFFAARSRWVLISTLIMQSALLSSMKPMPPMSAARL